MKLVIFLFPPTMCAKLVLCHSDIIFLFELSLWRRSVVLLRLFQVWWKGMRRDPIQKAIQMIIWIDYVRFWNNGDHLQSMIARNKYMPYWMNGILTWMLPSNVMQPPNSGLSAFMFFLFAIVLLFLGVSKYLGGCFPLASFGRVARRGLPSSECADGQP